MKEQPMSTVLCHCLIRCHPTWMYIDRIRSPYDTIKKQNPGLVNYKFYVNSGKDLQYEKKGSYVLTTLDSKIIKHGHNSA